MKLSIKAALFSAFIFPGAGYFIVQKLTQGIIFILIALSGLTIIIIDAVHKAQVIAEQIVSGVISINIELIREQILEAPGAFNPDILTGAYIVIGLVWLVSIVDCYRIGSNIEVRS